MSIQSLVDYAIENSLEGRPLDVDVSQSLVRPPLPEWLRVEDGLTGPIVVADVFEFDAASLTDFPLSSDRGPGSRMPPTDVDALAYYLPIHFYPRQWGIYYLDVGAIQLAEGLKGAPLTPWDQAWLDLAMQILYDHERFHFMAEVAVTGAEVALAADRGRSYPTFFRDPAAALLEEALANAQAYRRVRGKADPSISSSVETWMLGQGPGYRDFGAFVDDADWVLGKRQEGDFVLSTASPARPSSPALPTEFLFPNIGSYRIPQYMVLTTARRSIRLEKRFPKAFNMEIRVNTAEHDPPHFHLFTPPRDFKTRCTWPELDVMRGDPGLSRRERKNLERYLVVYGEEVRRKLVAAWGRDLPAIPT
ncbi:MAG: hypothetical protein P1P84_21020 [Deferrisomatales bacterium]|nr:hypothetical protein [Deferrisomatales bacterium]